MSDGLLDGGWNKDIYECGEGWGRILDTTYNIIIDTVHSVILQNVYVEQIKEKFGGLRIYLSKSIPEVENIITGAEILASMTCEICGSVKDVGISSNAWITLCPKCNNERHVTARFESKKRIWGSYEFIEDFANIVQRIGSYIEILGSDGSIEYYSVKYNAYNKWNRMPNDKKRHQCFVKKRPSRKIRKQFNGY